MAHSSINGSQCEGYLHIKSDLELFKVVFCFCLDYEQTKSNAVLFANFKTSKLDLQIYYYLQFT